MALIPTSPFLYYTGRANTVEQHTLWSITTFGLGIQALKIQHFNTYTYVLTGHKIWCLPKKCQKLNPRRFHFILTNFQPFYNNKRKGTRHLILTLKCSRQLPRHCKQKKSTAVLVKKTWRRAAGKASTKNRFH